MQEGPNPLEWDATTIASKLGRLPTRPTLLVVEDDPFAGQLMQQALEAHFNCMVAPTCALAEQLLRTADVDAVLLDLNLPDGNGIALLHFVQANPAQFVPVLAITSDTAEQTRVEALRSGCHDFVPKPFVAAELLLRVRIHMLLRDMVLQEATYREHVLDNYPALLAHAMQQQMPMQC